MDEMKILIVSGNCLSESNANGRTLLQLVGGIPKENLFQLYTSGEIPDGRFCAESFRVTNGDAVVSYWKTPGCGMPEPENGSRAAPGPAGNAWPKNAFTMLLRDLVWDHSVRLRRTIARWAKSREPDCVLLQIGDASLQVQIAMRLACDLGVPLIVYNTEDYYFKAYDYMKHTLSDNLTYRLFHSRFRRKFDAMMAMKPICIYNCEGLRKRYDDAFGTHSDVVFPSSDFKRVQEIKKEGLILYAGNLGVGRHRSLMEIGRALHKIDPSLYLDIYGAAPAEIQRALETAPGIRFHGFVSYAQVCEQIRNSRLLIHAESFDPFYAVDTKHAFSTKLTDYLMSGIPVFFYGPLSGEAAGYLNRHAAAIVVWEKENVQTGLRDALYDESLRRRVSAGALALAHKNHDPETNRKRLSDILVSKRGTRDWVST